MILPKAIRKLIESLEKLPGIGPKTAARLTFYLLNVPQIQLEELAEAILNLKKQTVICQMCFNTAETDPCSICGDPTRDKSVICVVEQPLDALVIERTGRFKGLYHVLGGAISPLNNIGPDELYIYQLIERIKNSLTNEAIKEIILATNPNLEGEATAMYIKKLIQDEEIERLKITFLARGLPTGGEIEYADEITLSRALEGRKEE